MNTPRSHAAAKRAAQVLKLKQAALKFLADQNERHLIETPTLDVEWEDVRQHESELSDLLRLICGRRFCDEVPEGIVMATAMRELAAEVETPALLRRQGE